jgi:uncharacterized membrane protein
MRRRADVPMIAMISSFSIALFILLGLGIAASPQLERAVLLSASVRDASPLSANEALIRHEAVRSFILSNGELDHASEEEKAHLRDVRRAVDIFVGIALIAIAIGIGALRTNPVDYRTIARRVSISIITLILVIGMLFPIFGYETVFWNLDAFLFAKETFIFPYDSFLITLYPRILFAHMTAWTLGLMVAIMGILYVLTRTKRYEARV